MPKDVYLCCRACQQIREYDLGTSDVGNIPDDSIGSPIYNGSLFDWIAAHHKRLAGEHNRFDVYDITGEKVGEAGFGSMTGYVYVPIDERRLP